MGLPRQGATTSATICVVAQALAGGRGLQVRQAPLEDVFLAVTLQAELEHAQVGGGGHAVAPLTLHALLVLAICSLLYPKKIKSSC